MLTVNGGVKRLRDFECIFTGSLLKRTVTRDTSFKTNDSTRQVARIWATGELTIETVTIQGEYHIGEDDCILTSSSFGYKISRTEHKTTKKVFFTDVETKEIKFEIISFGTLDDKQKKFLTKVVNAADYTY